MFDGSGGFPIFISRAEMMLTMNRRVPRKVRKDGVLSSPDSGSTKNSVPIQERKRDDSEKRVRGIEMARPGVEGKSLVDAMTAEK